MLKQVDDTLDVLHTHGVAGTLGGALTGLFAHPSLSSMFLAVPNSKGAFHGSGFGMQFLKRLLEACFDLGAQDSRCCSPWKRSLSYSWTRTKGKIYIY